MRLVISEGTFKKLFENSVSEYWEKKGIDLKNYFTDTEKKTRQCIEKYPGAFIEWCVSKYGNEFNNLKYCNFNEIYDMAIEMGANPNYFYNEMSENFVNGYGEFHGAPAHLTMHHEKTFSNKWVIHFTDHAEEIAKEGFKKGVDDFEQLPWTHNLTPDEKNGVFAFGHLVNTIKYEQMNQSCYGKDCVICLASGVETYHAWDEEYDAIFNGRAVRYVCPIFHDYARGVWYIKSIISDRVLYANKGLINVINWFTNNYRQYYKHLFYR